MPYEPSIWQDGASGKTPLLAAMLNKIEQGIKAATALAEAAVTKAAADAAYAPKAGEFPIGGMTPYVGATAPSGWLICNGQAVSRTEYAALFAVIGTAAGAGNGSTTFNIPDMRDRTVVGISTTAPRNVRGAVSGSATVVLTANQIPSHTHNVVVSNSQGRHLKLYASNAASGSQWMIGSNDDSGSADRFIAAATGGGQAHDNMMPNVAFHYIIRAK